MSKIKKYLVSRFIVLIPLTLICLSACSDPDYEIHNDSSGYIQDLQGKWVVINYWADWCPPCIKEMPELSSFYDANKQEVYVFAYNFDQLEGEELKEQIVRFKVKVPSMLTDPGELFGWETPDSLPATFIIDPKGVTKEMLIGPQTKETLEKVIQKYKES